MAVKSWFRSTITTRPLTVSNFLPSWRPAFQFWQKLCECYIFEANLNSLSMCCIYGVIYQLFLFTSIFLHLYGLHQTSLAITMNQYLFGPSHAHCCIDTLQNFSNFFYANEPKASGICVILVVLQFLLSTVMTILRNHFPCFKASKSM